MKKVLLFAPTAPTSGITQYILNMTSYIDTKTIAFDILSFRNPRLKEWTEKHGTEYFELDISPYKHPILYRKFLKKVFSNGYDVVHFHISSISNLTIFKFAKRAGIKKIIAHSHSSSIDIPSKLRRIVFGRVHKILRVFANKYFHCKCACSVPAAEWMFGKKNSKKAIVLNNAIDVDKFVFNEDNRKNLRDELGINTKYVIGHVGRFSIQKNQMFLVNVFSELVKKRDDCTLMMIGNGDLLNSVKNHVTELGLNEKTVFVDFQEDIYRYYSVMDLFVMTSLLEGLPITLVEAQANGLSALVSDSITKESDITGLLEFCSLSDSLSLWAEKISEKLENCDRVDVTEKIEKLGFSLKNQTKIMYDIYFD